MGGEPPASGWEAAPSASTWHVSGARVGTDRARPGRHCVLRIVRHAAIACDRPRHGCRGTNGRDGRIPGAAYMQDASAQRQHDVGTRPASRRPRTEVGKRLLRWRQAPARRASRMPAGRATRSAGLSECNVTARLSDLGASHLSPWFVATKEPKQGLSFAAGGRRARRRRRPHLWNDCGCRAAVPPVGRGQQRRTTKGRPTPARSRKPRHVDSPRGRPLSHSRTSDSERRRKRYEKRGSNGKATATETTGEAGTRPRTGNASEER